MTKQELQQRFEYLGNVLSLSRGLGYFNSGQRTCMHIERAALMHAQEVINLSGEESVMPEYTIPEHLEAKCDQVIEDFK